MKRSGWLAGLLLLVWGLLAGCSGLRTAPAGAPPGRTEEPTPAVFSAAEAKAILVKWYHTPAPDGLELTTGRQREFHEAIERERQAGRTHKALPYWIDEKSDIAVVQGNEQYAIVQLRYENSFNRHDETVLFRLENVGGRWLIANHTDSSGIWWPDSLTQPPQSNSHAADAANVKLVPYTGEVGFKVLVPDGWKAQPTALGDLVQWSHGDVRMFVLGTQRRGTAIPHTVDEMKRYMVTDSAAPDAQVTAMKVAGAESAFEVIYSKNDNGGTTFLSLYMFGSTYREVLWFTVPTRLYPQWEPLLRQIMQSYQPGNLNAVPLPGRP